MTTYMGKPLKRFEDERLVRGQGAYVDDMVLPNMLHAAVLRSPHAHARILSIDTSKAEGMPGVVAVATAASLGIESKEITAIPREGMEAAKPPAHPVLAHDKACYVGQAVAIAIAKDRYLARDAIDLIQVEYEPLPPVLDPLLAASGEAPPIHEDQGTNVMMRITAGRGNIEEAFANSDVVLRERYEVPRLSAVPMECRGLLASYDPDADVLTLWTSTQVPYRVKRYLSDLLEPAPKEVRVIAPDVGGGFGRKIEVWPEEVALSLLAMRLGRPIKWSEDRMENMVSTHGRGYSIEVEAGVKNDGTILGMRFRMVADVGAYFLTATGGPLGNAVHRVAGPYAIPVMDVECLGVLTNRPPTGPYRGAGGPEASVPTERMVDRIAHELGLDPVEVRKRNLLRPDAFPYTTATGLTYDSGNYMPVLDRALELAKYDELRRRQREAAPGGPRLGVGVATVVKASGGTAATRTAVGAVKVEPSGEVKVYTEASPHGQGTETTFAQIAADVLGVPPEAVQVLHGDTDMLPTGGGTSSSRGLVVAGSAAHAALQMAAEKIAKVAAHLLRCSPADVVLREGAAIDSQNPDRRMAFSEVATTAYRTDQLPPELEAGLEFQAKYTLPANPYGFAAHVAVVSVDPDTGETKLLDYVAVHDIGRVVNPMIVEGQMHGGIVQGIGQALSEGMVYDAQGQPVTGSLMNYGVPLAEDIPPLLIDSFVTPSPTNPLGVKGMGELPTVAAPPAVANAILDALQVGGARIDTPLTSEKVWRAMS